MRSCLFCLLLLVSWCAPAGAQSTTPSVGNPLKELRASLAPLDVQRIPTHVLMNRVMLFTDPTRFAGQGDTAASYPGFEQQYWEYYHASLDTTHLLTLDSLRAMTARHVQQQDDLPLLMLSYCGPDHRRQPQRPIPSQRGARCSGCQQRPAAGSNGVQRAGHRGIHGGARHYRLGSPTYQRLAQRAVPSQDEAGGSRENPATQRAALAYQPLGSQPDRPGANRCVMTTATIAFLTRLFLNLLLP